MNVSKLGPIFTAIRLLNRKNPSLPAAHNTGNASGIDTKPPGKLDTDHADKRLQTLQQGLKRLESMSGLKRTTKQDAANRVGLLQRRMEALKMMLRNASPEQAKALARELKSIAGELSSAAKALGDGGGGSSGQNASIDADNAPTATNAQTGSPQSPTEEASDVGKAENIPPENDPAQITDTDNNRDSDTESSAHTDDLDTNGAQSDNPNSDEIDNGVLRGLIMDAKKMLKEVIDALKPKLAGAGKEAKKDLLDAEKKLSEMDRSLQETENSTAHVYTALGSFSLDAAGSSANTESGSIVSVTV